MTHQSEPTQPRFHIFGLAALALSLPIFITLAQSEEFFLVYRAPRSAIIAFALTIGIALPLILQLLTAAIRRINPKLDQPTQATAIAILSATALMPNAKKLPLLPGWVILTLCAMLGVITAYYYLRNNNLRALISLLSIAALTYPLWFITQSQIVFPPKIETHNNTVERVNQPNPPAFIIVYDEFSLPTILTDERLIDRELYPNFARLADKANWFRNATTVADMTTDAVPAIFTGNYPNKPFNKTPTYQNYPENIFTILNRYGYDIYAHEFLTSICPLIINRHKSPRPSLNSELKSFATDILIITGHILLKGDLAEYIPPIKGMVARFTQTAVTPANDGNAPIPQGGDPREDPFNALLQAIEPLPGRAYIIHLSFPHQVYRYTQSGAEYLTGLDFTLQTSFQGQGDIWDPDPSHTTRAMQRYFHQLQYSDQLLGRLLDKLDALNIYDQALIAIIADHGISFRPQLPMRSPVPAGKDTIRSFENAIDIVKVPAILKLPNQQHPTIIDEPFQTIDLLPTIIDALDLGPTDSFDGRPMLSTAHTTLPQYKFFSKYNQLFVEHNLDILDKRFSMADKYKNIERKPGFPIRNPYTQLLAQGPIEKFISTQTSNITATLMNPTAYQDIDPASRHLPALIHVQLKNTPAAQTNTPILVNLNGKFGAIATTYQTRGGNTWIAALLPETIFLPGPNTIQLYQIAKDQNQAPRLLKIELH